MTQTSFAQRLLRWQRRHGRHDLPWQNTRDPYRVWLSEVMLQQTQVSTVLGYYERFLRAYPTVQALAAASLDEVLALWSGLGYYSRARNLHRCAQAVVHAHGGAFPRTAQALAQLPGIGRSTAAAIAAFCFDERVAILDGNVKRVLTRLLAFEGDLAQAAQEKALWALAESLLPQNDVARYTQGLMDLGALVCLPRDPACSSCPAQALCRASVAGRVHDFPRKTRKLRRSQRSHALLLLRWRDEVWLQQRPAQGVWAGLWSLPEFEAHATLDALSAHWPGQGHWGEPFRHVLTHFDWDLQVLHWTLPAAATKGRREAVVGELGLGRWWTVAEALQLGLPAPIRKLLS